MSDYIPRIRVHAESGYLLIQDGMSLSFYMKRTHEESAPAALHALDIYSSAVGPRTLELYADQEGDWQTLEDSGCAYFQREILAGHRSNFHLISPSSAGPRYQFEYHGKSLESLSMASNPGAVSAVSFWLPTEYLVAQGPARVRELALEIRCGTPLLFRICGPLLEL